MRLVLRCEESALAVFTVGQLYEIKSTEPAFRTVVVCDDRGMRWLLTLNERTGYLSLVAAAKFSRTLEVPT